MGAGKREILVIGQGIAGSVLAWLLHGQGYSVTIVDDGHRSSSSMVAAGMWNPVSFKKLSMTWLADKLLPAAASVYRDMEKQLGCAFFFPTELARIFPDPHAMNQWDERSQLPLLAPFLSCKSDPGVRRNFRQPFGHGIVEQAGWMDVPAMILAVRKFFTEKGRMREGIFSSAERENLLSQEDPPLVLYCTGWKKTDPLFDFLPIVPNKGQVLTIANTEWKLERMVNFGKFILPLGNDRYRLGATYELDQTLPDSTGEGREELLAQLGKVSDAKVHVLDHRAGFRPTIPDRKPVIGFLPDHPQIGVFNGFGSKGVMLVPFFAQHLIGHLQGGGSLMSDVNVLRYRN